MISRTSGIDWKSLLLTNVLTIRHAENKAHQPSTAKDFQRPESKNKPSVTNPNSAVTKTWIQDSSWSGLKFLFLCKLFSFYVFSNFCSATTLVQQLMEIKIGHKICQSEIVNENVMLLTICLVLFVKHIYSCYLFFCQSSNTKLTEKYCMNWTFNWQIFKEHCRTLKICVKFCRKDLWYNKKSHRLDSHWHMFWTLWLQIKNNKLRIIVNVSPPSLNNIHWVLMFLSRSFSI